MFVSLVKRCSRCCKDEAVVVLLFEFFGDVPGVDSEHGVHEEDAGEHDPVESGHGFLDSKFHITQTDDADEPADALDDFVFQHEVTESGEEEIQQSGGPFFHDESPLTVGQEQTPVFSLMF